MANILGCSKNQLPRTLKNLEGTIKFETERQGMKRGHVKVIVNPAYGFKYPAKQLKYARGVALKSWMEDSIKKSADNQVMEVKQTAWNKKLDI